MKHSIYQEAIFNFIKNTEDSLLIKATAGSGKTTTILEALNLIPKNKSIIFVSFSNTIVNELKSRVPSHVKATTLHGLGYSILRNKRPNLKLNNNKLFSQILPILEELNKERSKEDKIDRNELFVQVYKIIEIINAVKLTCTENTLEKILELGLSYSLEVTTENIGIAHQILKSCRTLGNEIDFTDMIYLPLVLNDLKTFKYDYIFYDEIQDANKAQLMLVEKLLKKDGRLIMVGDWHQAIYGFSFADISSLDYLQNRKNTKSLPLSVCYRCGKDIVIEAQKVNDEIQFFEDKESGLVKRNSSLDDVKEKDIVVCRNVKPLFVTALDLFKQKKRAYIVGKDYQEELSKLIKKITKGSDYLDKYQIKDAIKELLSEIELNLLEIGIKKPKQNKKYLHIEELTQIIDILLDNFGPQNLEITVKQFFKEDDNSIRLMTIHKSKGLEADRVFFIESFEKKKLIPSQYATLPWELEQEKNLEFVAITRAKKELHYIKL